MTTRRKKINRRDFLKITGVTLGGTVLAACGVQTGQPAHTPQPPTLTPAPPTATPIPSLAEQLSADPVALLDQDLLAALIRENPQEYQPLLDQMSQGLQQEPAWLGLGLQDFELAVLLINPDQNYPREWMFMGTTEGQTWAIARFAGNRFETIRKPIVAQTNPDGVIELKVDDLTLFKSNPEGGTYVTRMDNSTIFAEQVTIRQEAIGGKKVQADMAFVPLDSSLGIVSTRFAEGTMFGYDQDKNILASYDFEKRSWKVYATTEYTGTFSEKYGEPEFTDTFTYTQEKSGLSIPIHIGLDTDGLPGSEDDLPISEVHLTDLGKEFLGELWLAACYYRYTDIMGKNVTMDQYSELVKAGGGRVEAYVIDELTGKKGTSLIDPRKGFSVTLTGRDDASLEPFPANAKYPVHMYLSMNAAGQPIIVVQWNQEMMKSNYGYSVIERGRTLGYFYSAESFPGLIMGIKYWAAIDSASFFSQGRISGFEKFSLGEDLDKLYNEPWKNVNPQTDTSTPFASIK